MIAINASVSLTATLVLIYRFQKKFYFKYKAGKKIRELNELKIKKAAQLKAVAASRVFPDAEAKRIQEILDSFTPRPQIL
jgi:hypothetical protein